MSTTQLQVRAPTTHPLVDQLRFTRSEWLRGLQGLSEEDGARHFGQMNSVGWIVGHLTWQEQRYHLDRPRSIVLYPAIKERFAFGAPMSTPSLAEMLEAWHAVTVAADRYLDSLTTAALVEDLPLEGQPSGQTKGNALRRITYHYWYHTGEIQAIRQLLAHKDLPDFVGDIDNEAPYRPEQAPSPRADLPL